MTRSQAHIILNYFCNLSINQQVHIAAPVVNYVISPSEGNISAEDPQGYQSLSLIKRQIDKEYDKLDISV